jgi:hypothetical protein
VVGSFTTPGCGWIDYSYWAPTPSTTSGASVNVFSRSSSVLCGGCPHVLRLLCGCWQCYGDNGVNLQHVQQVVDRLREQHPSATFELEVQFASCT